MNRVDLKKQIAKNFFEFQNSEAFKGRREALDGIVQSFKMANVNYTLFCSVALYFTGLLNNFNDLDILVSEKDYEKAMKCLEQDYEKVTEERCGIIISSEVKFSKMQLKGLGKLMSKSTFSSKRFSKWVKKDKSAEIDLIAGFSTDGVIYNYDKNDCIMIATNIRILKAEVQYLLYRAMEISQPKRYIKRKKLEEYILCNRKNVDRNTLSRGLKNINMSEHTSRDIKKLLSTIS